MSLEVDLIRAKNTARTVQAVASAYGEPVPGYEDLMAIALEAQRVSREAHAPVPVTMPADPTKVAEHIKKAATARVAQRESIAIATDLADRAEREAARIALEQAPRVAFAVKAAFDKAAAALLELAPTAPREITAASTADDFGAHTRLLSLVDTLNLTAQQRISLASALGEDLRGTADAWLVLAPHGSVTRDTIRQVLARYSEALPATLEDWLRIAAMGAAMAAPGEAEARASRFNAATFAAGQTSPDGGMADRTYGSMLEALAGREVER